MERESRPEPQSEYTRRLELHRTGHALHRRKDVYFSAARFAVFLAGCVLLFLVVSSPGLPALTLLAPAVLFLVLVGLHSRCRRSIEAAGRREAYYERGLARLRDERPAEASAQGERAPEDHLFAEDLDLFGPGSLYEMLCAAGTGVGRRRLAQWLSVPAPLGEARRRQPAVKELAGRLDLREDMALVGLDADASLASEAIERWASAPHPLGDARLRLLTALLAMLTGVALGAWGLGAVGPLPFVVMLLIQYAFGFRHRMHVAEVLKTASSAAAELRVLAGLLARLEGEQFESEELVRLRSEMNVEGLPPSRQVARLARRVDVVDQLRHNQLLYPLALVFMGIPQGAMAIEAWRAHVGPSIGRWLGAIGEFEALASLARFSYEHPDYPFPELVEGGALFEARELGHPLLPAASRVRNDVSLGGERRLLLVSGSNMSGKSTFLRTVGVNAVLALAGAPVCAAGLRISSLELGASIRVQDSLLKGSSRFYAEISRIKAIVSRAAGDPPLLFLLDEIFGGTNSQDRRVGASAVIRALVERGAIGLVTTHDLALAKITEELGSRAANVHFEDEYRDGRIFFDFRVRPGLLEHGNALALMRSIGLEV